jgi:hypothetical protein
VGSEAAPSRPPAPFAPGAAHHAAGTAREGQRGAQDDDAGLGEERRDMCSVSSDHSVTDISSPSKTKIPE